MEQKLKCPHCKQTFIETNKMKYLDKIECSNCKKEIDLSKAIHDSRISELKQIIKDLDKQINGE